MISSEGTGADGVDVDVAAPAAGLAAACLTVDLVAEIVPPTSYIELPVDAPADSATHNAEAP